MSNQLPEGAIEVLDYSHGQCRQNLILLPSMSEALSLYATGLAMIPAGSRKYYTQPNEMAQYVLGNKCHLNEELLGKIASLSDRVVEAVYDLNPSLAATPRYNRTEVDDLWDAGLIAMGDERPCFTSRYDGEEPSKGKGDGAYRILINTDTCWGNSDSQGLATLICLTTVLSHFNPVEVWVQQGWLSYGYNDSRTRKSGITCFRVGAMSSINLASMAFWLGSPLRDGLFSQLVNKGLGREHSGVSVTAAIPCDFYTNNGVHQNVPCCSHAITAPNTDQGKAQIKQLAEWVSKISQGIIYPDSIDNAINQVTA